MFGDAAINQRWARRRLGAYVLKAAGLLAIALALAWLAGLLLDDAGNTKPGLPEFLPGVFIVPALLAALLGTLTVINALRMAWVLARHPWRTVHCEFHEWRTGTPNGQPVLLLTEGRQESVLTLAAVRWRWRRFASSGELLVAGPPGKGSVVAPTDRSTLAWAGRSVFTVLMLRWAGRRHRRGPGEAPGGSTPV